MTENEELNIDDCLKELKKHRDVYLKRCTPWRIVNRAIRLIEQYRAIGTLEELQNMKDHLLMVKGMCKDYYEIGTIEEFKDLKEKSEQIPIIHGKAELELHDKGIRNNAIDEFVERLKDLIAKNVEDAESSNDLCCEIYQSDIDEIAEEMRGGNNVETN